MKSGDQSPHSKTMELAVARALGPRTGLGKDREDQNHRWTPMDTDKRETRNKGLRGIKIKTQVSGFACHEYQRQFGNLCSSVSICGFPPSSPMPSAPPKSRNPFVCVSMRPLRTNRSRQGCSRRRFMERKHLPQHANWGHEPRSLHLTRFMERNTCGWK